MVTICNLISVFYKHGRFCFAFFFNRTLFREVMLNARYFNRLRSAFYIRSDATYIGVASRGL